MEMDLKMPCPVCVDEGRYTQSHTWNHATHSCSSGGKRVLRIDDSGYIRCPACQRKWGIMGSRWGCPHHSQNPRNGPHSYDYRAASYAATVNAIQFACAKYKNQPGQAWFERLMRNLYSY
jgi:hypothetical protein